MPGEHTTSYRGIHAAAWCIEMTADKSVREKIINDFSEWTAFSATRSGCPFKSRDVVYPLIRTPKYHYVLNGNVISTTEFDDWHEESTLAICAVAPMLPVGWATKLINVYLKSMVYLAGLGRPSLVECIHPPIDNGLWEGIRSEYRHRLDILSKTHIVHKIKDINTYEKYKTIMHGCHLVAEDRGCYLIEIEELWQGTEI